MFGILQYKQLQQSNWQNCKTVKLSHKFCSISIFSDQLSGSTTVYAEPALALLSRAYTDSKNFVQARRKPSHLSMSQERTTSQDPLNKRKHLLGVWQCHWLDDEILYGEGGLTHDKKACVCERNCVLGVDVCAVVIPCGREELRRQPFYCLSCQPGVWPPHRPFIWISWKWKFWHAKLQQ